MKMSRTQLFGDGFSVMMRCGPMWLVALVVAAVDMLLSRLLVVNGTLGTILTTLRSALTGAFLTGALIVLTNAVAEHQPTTFGEGFAAGARFYPTLLAIDLILAVPALVFGQLVNLFMAPITSQIMQTPDAAGLQKMISTLGVMLCLLLPLLLLAFLLVAGITSALGLGAERSVALEGTNVWNGLKRGWDVLTDKLGDMLLIGLMMLGIVIVFFLFFGCAAGIVFVGANLFTLGAPSAVSKLSSNVIFNILTTLVTIPIQIWFSVIWTLAFRRWQGKTALQPLPIPQIQTQPPAIPPAGE
jgi:hypothetical protein